ncbi:flagellar hook-basal body complex protein FliE [Paenibacillus sp. TRM 82003]|uniref:flagellar hook-basal body complex protein FliE n=1 Tax=Kineococcus sp. TRM81007 TaxID=2925831 RepID=UPI001F56A4B1|nr:flagellar hook-basal body complex protein FliE [Kineococcus sp. TRM81007]MCI2240613.1 flagellar hook-basal body complex protein FliE [Kineococcus sp. TRM81007]MCI3925465.1 flagellar hook-basal body complex protein FliE [Paenibacillus sp. TRM 82003]
MSIESIGAVGGSLGTQAVGWGQGLENTDNAQMTRGVTVGDQAVVGTTGIANLAGVTGTTGTGAVGDASGTDFATLLSGGLDKLQSVQSRADDLAVKAATGDLTNVHDYMIASNEAQLTTQLTVAIRDKAVEAFNEIMRMQI